MTVVNRSTVEKITNERHTKQSVTKQRTGTDVHTQKKKNDTDGGPPPTLRRTSHAAQRPLQQRIQDAAHHGRGLWELPRRCCRRRRAPPSTRPLLQILRSHDQGRNGAAGAGAGAGVAAARGAFRAEDLVESLEPEAGAEVQVVVAVVVEVVGGRRWSASSALPQSQAGSKQSQAKRSVYVKP